MQETLNNCFGLKKCSMTLLQAKIGKHKCRNVTQTFFDLKLHCCYISALMLTCFLLTKGRTTYFWPETIVASFLHIMVLLFKVLFNHSWKRQFVVLRYHASLSKICFIYEANRSLLLILLILCADFMKYMNVFKWKPSEINYQT